MPGIKNHEAESAVSRRYFTRFPCLLGKTYSRLIYSPLLGSVTWHVVDLMLPRDAVLLSPFQTHYKKDTFSFWCQSGHHACSFWLFERRITLHKLLQFIDTKVLDPHRLNDPFSFSNKSLICLTGRDNTNRTTRTGRLYVSMQPAKPIVRRPTTVSFSHHPSLAPLLHKVANKNRACTSHVTTAAQPWNVATARVVLESWRHWPGCAECELAFLLPHCSLRQCLIFSHNMSFVDYIPLNLAW